MSNQRQIPPQRAKRRAAAAIGALTCAVLAAGSVAAAVPAFRGQPRPRWRCRSRTDRQWWRSGRRARCRPRAEQQHEPGWWFGPRSDGRYNEQRQRSGRRRARRRWTYHRPGPEQRRQRGRERSGRRSGPQPERQLARQRSDDRPDGSLRLRRPATADRPRAPGAGDGTTTPATTTTPSGTTHDHDHHSPTCPSSHWRHDAAPPDHGARWYDDARRASPHRYRGTQQVAAYRQGRPPGAWRSPGFSRRGRGGRGRDARRRRAGRARRGHARRRADRPGPAVQATAPDQHAAQQPLEHDRARGLRQQPQGRRASSIELSGRFPRASGSRSASRCCSWR